MNSRHLRAIGTLVAVLTLSTAFIAFQRLTAAPSNDLGWVAPQEVPPRMVGDVTRDGRIRASDALAVLVHVVGKELPAHFRVDPDGDVACRGSVARTDGGPPPDWQRPVYELVNPAVTAADALMILSHVVGKELPWGLWPDGHCGGLVYEPQRHSIDLEVFSGLGDTLIMVEGRTYWDWVSVYDTIDWFPLWQNGVNDDPQPEGAYTGLIRTRSDDPTVARIDTIQEWTHALVQYIPGSPGTTQVYASWFGSEDTMTVIVHPWVPASMSMSIRPIDRFGRAVHGELTVGDTTRVDWVTAHDTLGFNKGLGFDSVTFASSDPSVVTIDSDGLISGVALGSAEITASWSAFSVSDSFAVLSDGAAVEADIAASFNGWWLGNHHSRAPGPLLSVAADQHTSSWRNFGMEDAGHEPRQAWDNTPYYVYAYATAEAWYRLWDNLWALGWALTDLDGGLQLGDAGADTDRARAFAKFVQGLSLGTMALVFDQTPNITEDQVALGWFEFLPYSDAMDLAIASLTEAITISEASSFTIPEAWMSGSHTSAELVQIAHSFIARFMASVPRTWSERAAVDWSSVMSHVDQGITSDFTVYGEDDQWWDALKTYATIPGWARIDYRTLGPADQSGAYQAWMALPVEDRNEFLIDTDDRRVTGGAADSNGLYFGYMGPSPFRTSRGTYHFSFYGNTRYDDYSDDGFGDMEEIIVAEMDFLKAEALYRMGDSAGALAIINQYRTTNGQLPAATTDGVGGQTRCTPRLADGACGDLWETLKYEKRLEVFHTGLGDAFFDDRGWGDLVERTFYHLPVPGEVLEMFGMDYYTFGGDEPWMELGAPGRVTLDPEMMSRILEDMRARRDAQFTGREEGRRQTPH